MKRLVVFSTPNTPKLDEILSFVFPESLKNKKVAYLPVGGKNSKEEYTSFWREKAKQYKAEFLFIDSTNENLSEEKEKLDRANTLLISGGNTFQLLHDLKKNGLFEEIKKFKERDEFVIAGWSAGAVLMTPTIEVSGRPNRDGGKSPADENKVGVTDLTALGFIDFEVFPHFDEMTQKQTFEEYNIKKHGKVKALKDGDYLVIEC